jgi:hypothetical protein
LKINVIAFAAAALSAAGATAQTTAAWPLTVQLTSGSRFCNEGTRATIQITGNALSIYYQGESFARWTIPLGVDGSADATVRALNDELLVDYMHVKVPAGAGPREISAVSQRDACRWRLLPG